MNKAPEMRAAAATAKKLGEVRANLERKMASEVSYPFGTTVGWTEGDVEKKGIVTGFLLKVRENGKNRDDEIFFSEILDKDLSVALLEEKDIPFPLESAVSWRGAYENMWGPTTGMVKKHGKVTGYVVEVTEPDGTINNLLSQLLTAHTNPGGFRKRQTKKARKNRRSYSRRRK